MRYAVFARFRFGVISWVLQIGHERGAAAACVSFIFYFRHCLPSEGMTCRCSYVIRLCAQKDEEIKKLSATIRQLQQALELEKSDVRQLRSLCASLESDLVSSLDYATAAQVMLVGCGGVCCRLTADSGASAASPRGNVSAAAAAAASPATQQSCLCYFRTGRSYQQQQQPGELASQCSPRRPLLFTLFPLVHFCHAGVPLTLCLRRSGQPRAMRALVSEQRQWESCLRNW